MLLGHLYVFFGEMSMIGLLIINVFWILRPYEICGFTHIFLPFCKLPLSLLVVSFSAQMSLPWGKKKKELESL